MERTRDGDGEPLDQPMSHKVRHFVAWMMYHVRGGVETGRELSKKEVELFRNGHVVMARLGSTKEDASVSVVHAAVPEEEEAELQRRGGPTALAADSAYRTSGGAARKE